MKNEKKKPILVLPPNKEFDEVIGREAFEKGGSSMSMSRYFITLYMATLPEGVTVEERLEELRKKQSHIPAFDFKRGNRKRLFNHV